MDDQWLWNSGVTSLNGVHESLLPEDRQRLDRLLVVYRREKEGLTAIIEAAGGGSCCNACGGQCCMNGKYRMNLLDWLAIGQAASSMVPDFGQKPICPYALPENGCRMPPELRPADCVVFICDILNDRLTEPARTCVIECERTIRECLQEASGLTGHAVAEPFLLWAEKMLQQDCQTMGTRRV